MKLTAESVEEILRKCLVRDRDAIKKYESVDVSSPHRKEVVDDICIVLGLDGYRYYFDTTTLEQNKNDIKDLLLRLPMEFMSSTAMGGSSFLKACLDSGGHQWGEQENVDKLLALGKAVDLAQTALPMPHTLVMVMDARPETEPQSHADIRMAKNNKAKKIFQITAIIILSPIILASLGIYTLVERIVRQHPKRK